MKPIFRVLEPDGSEPDLEKIALTEDWADGLMYCDMDQFLIDNDGHVALTDECGKIAWPPLDRFKIEWLR